MSFGVVGIAIDRLITVYNLMQIEKTEKKFQVIKNNTNQLLFVQVNFKLLILK